ncbi:hypothetical protein TUM19329_34900 [Legionella antarctica]|uniref:Transposase IS701-like DDE domain-containing protein n=1 Tax=Legionella antarctica TaxID=2708020 RepID=A0A6F8T2R3_9GAMM|nr:transposase [Legionella antarctica]BCA93672.1 hypothetical protein TUM19329_00330 [Legionella antarctica]BCA93777.1 hypothetical protein TUM19329_01380 [Legionella antarctica]BCA94276.1 hypothetical protein TUM19329_06370 [Legionella antarctica]BCA94721.1 hypothetical protein TUM19329_10820 [Legionella antarctica]BCA95120.1 hypothetical protein TUM19329_14810 [Legionella antarctica]
MTPEIISVLAAFAPLFTRPTWNNINTLFIGAILCRGARRITSILRVMGLSEVKNFSKYHRVLSRTQWSGLTASKILFGLLITLLPESWPKIVAVDETLERRRGKNIKAKGAYRDAVASSQSRVVICFGLKWECMTLIVPLPWCKRPWALPFMVILSPSKKSDEASGKRHKTSIDWTIQMVRCVSRWLHRTPWILVGDGAYACMALAKVCIKNGATLISRVRMDAQLFEFPEVKPAGKRGRNQIKGQRIRLKELLVDTKTWDTLQVKWYGGEQKTIECLTFECLWYHAGVPPIRLRIVLVKTPDGKNEAETFFSTNTENSPTQIIEWFVLRWNIEVTFEETRAHLGIETQRQWSDKAIARTTPLLMGLLSILVLVAIKMHETKKLLVQETTSWYDKKGELTLVDIITAIRRSIWVKMYFSMSKNYENNTDSLKITEKTANLLIYQLALAA